MRYSDAFAIKVIWFVSRLDMERRATRQTRAGIAVPTALKVQTSEDKCESPET